MAIYGQQRGLVLRRSHRGQIDLVSLEKEILTNIRELIPLATDRINQLLVTRSYQTNGKMKPVVAQVCRDHRIARPLASQVLRALQAERKQTPEYSSTLFELVNSFTRATQLLDNETWVRFDELGGRLARYSSDRWEDLVSRASSFSTRDVDKTFLRWSPDATTEISA